MEDVKDEDEEEEEDDEEEEEEDDDRDEGAQGCYPCFLLLRPCCACFLLFV